MSFMGAGERKPRCRLTIHGKAPWICCVDSMEATEVLKNSPLGAFCLLGCWVVNPSAPQDLVLRVYDLWVGFLGSKFYTSFSKVFGALG